VSTRKSHKSRRKAVPQKPVNPEGSVVSRSGSSSDTPTTPDSVALVPSSSHPVADILTAVDGDAKDTPTGSVPTLVAPPPLPARPYWYRQPDSKSRKLCEKIVVMRAAGRDDAYIAKKLDTTEQTVRQYVYLGHKNGWLDNDGEPVDLEAELALDIDRKTVRNIGHSLDGGMTNWQTHEMTLAAAKGRGIFKNHEKSDGSVSQSLPVVAIQVIMPPVGAGDQVVVEANVGGVPAFVEGEAVTDVA